MFSVLLNHKNYLIVCLLALLFMFAIFNTAWLSDDSFITIRQVFNFVNGIGMHWNIGERVQAFTHPTWFLIISAASFITKEYFYTVLAVSILFSFATLYIVISWCYRENRLQVCILPLSVLLFSYAFIDYTTSGLENCLSYLLFAIFFIQLTSDKCLSTRKLLFLSLLAAMIVLNRFDYAVILLPVVIYLILEYRTKIILPCILGASIILVWLIYATVYFGYPLPNTFYAKMATDLPLHQYIFKGLTYYFVQLTKDPITLVFIFLMLINFKQYKGITKYLAIGVMLYLLYLFKIGGDFMQGRFFAVPLFISTLIMINLFKEYPLYIKKYTKVFLYTMLITIVGRSLYDHQIYRPPFLASHTYDKKNISNGQVADERGYYYLKQGLMSPQQRYPKINQSSIFNHKIYKKVQMHGDGKLGNLNLEQGHEKNFGRIGLEHGHDTYFIDIHALTSPLLAKLPAKKGKWRTGHQVRKIPQGYVESIEQSKNLILNPQIKNLYDDISLVTKGKLFTKERLKAIFRLNTHNYNIPRGYE